MRKWIRRIHRKKAKAMKLNEQRPTAEEWEAMFDILAKDLLSLEEIANDPEVDAEVANEARLQMNELRPILHKMRVSRGFIPGRTANI